MESAFRSAKKAIDEAKNILLVTHINPDGDAISSVCAMAGYLRSIGKPHRSFCQNEPPACFGFLPCVKDIGFRVDSGGAPRAMDLQIGDFDLVLVFDCASLERTGIAEEIRGREAKTKIAEFDHHPRTVDYADIEIRDSSAASTTEVVHDFFRSSGIGIDKEIAESILTGIITDTGNFLFPSASGKTIRTASEMLAKGANLTRIVSRTMRNKSIESLRLWGTVMARLKKDTRYGLAYTYLTHEDLERFQVSEEEIEGLSNFLSNMKEARAVMFLREREPGVVKGSLRTSDGSVDVSKLAVKLGGGGHAKASGFTMEGHLHEIGSGDRLEIV